jgi:hypothetical protein
MEQNNSAAACGTPFDAFDIGRALRNSTMYEQVYVWMHEKNVENWNYSRAVKVNGSTETECATVTYDTFIDSPTFFAQMLRNFKMSMRFPIGVRKEVCVEGASVVETATVSVPVIHELSMTSRYEVGADEVHSSLEAEYHVPWYIDFLMYDIEKHLRENFALKLDSVAQSLCAPRGAQHYALLRSPAEKFSGNSFPRSSSGPSGCGASKSISGDSAPSIDPSIAGSSARRSAAAHRMCLSITGERTRRGGGRGRRHVGLAALRSSRQDKNAT